jgi:hypothetical protein
VIDEDQYTGDIAWETSGGAHGNSTPFAGGTVYQAVVTLSAKTGYTFTGVAADSFTYTGATAVTNSANSGTVTITFPPTTNTGIPIGNPSVTLYLDNTALVTTSTTITQGTGTFTVSIASGTYSGITWRVNGNTVAEGPEKFSLVLSKQTAGTYLVTVEAQPSGGVKDSGAHTFVVQ